MSIRRQCVAVFILFTMGIMLCISDTAVAEDKIAIWRTTGIVFEAAKADNHETEYELLQDDYQLEDISVIAHADGVSYCSARLTYNTNEYQVQDVIDILAASGKYTHIEQDTTLYSDAFLYNRADTNMSSQWYLNTIGADKAWKVNGEPGKGVVVAVIDTGVDYTHKDLKDNIWINETEADGLPGVDDDNNGITDDIYGANFATDNKTPDKLNDPMDSEDGHGTHVAGIIAMGKDNGGGRGIAYSSKIMSVKAGNADGSFKLSAVIAALDYAVDMGADVINMSFGTYTESSVLKSMLERAAKKSVLVAAAGNDGFVTSDYSGDDAKAVYPGSYPFVIGVMAVDNRLNIPKWSNYDYEPHSGVDYEVAAPGYNILSTMPGGKYAYMHGTSMAAPMVSAAAAILYSSIDKSKISNPVAYIHSQITQASKTTTIKVAADGKSITYPILNVYDALTVSPGINLNINTFRYYDNISKQEFSTELETKSDSVDIYCGFRINNLWSDAESIKVHVKADSALCTGEEKDINIIKMNSVSSIDINHESQESYVFHINAKAGEKYSIPIIYTVEAKMAGSDTEYRREFRDSINVSFQNQEQAIIVTTHADNNTLQSPQQHPVSTETDNTSISVDKVKGLSVKKRSAKRYKNIISWNKVSNAKKYIVYYSEKRNGHYKRLAATAKKTYTHTLSAKKTLYYKVRAYAVVGGEKIYGKYSSVLRVKR